MYPVQPILKRAFVSTGAVTNIPIPSDATKVEVYDLTNIALLAGGNTASHYLKCYSVKGMPAGSGFNYAGNGTNTTIVETLLPTAGNGITFYNSSITAPGNAVAVTAVTAANPAVVSTANTTGLIAGQSIVRMINLTGMQQISSIDFTVGTVTPGASFGLKYLDASTFAAPGTSGFYRLIPADSIYYPRNRIITKIAQGTTTTITMSVTHGFTVGQLVRVSCTSDFGMSQIDGMLGTVLSYTTGATNTITLDIDSSSFTAFAFPTSADAAKAVYLPQIIPVGEAAVNTPVLPVANLLDDATVNQSSLGVTLGASVVGAPGDSMLLMAYSGLSF